MGKGSKPIIGFHYRPAFHHGLTIEIDAFLEMRGGDRTAWQGRLTTSGTLSINAPHLFGGEKDQGGMVGNLDVMFGESTQGVNSYLVSTFGSQVPAWRGLTTVVWKGGRYGAMNPYPQKASYKVERILNGWDGGVAWYPAKAVISTGGGSMTVDYTDVWSYKTEAPGSTADYSAAAYDHSGWPTGPGGFGTEYIGKTVGTIVDDLLDKAIWLRRRVSGAAGDVTISGWHDDAVEVWWNGELVHSALALSSFSIVIPSVSVTGDDALACRVVDSAGGGNIFIGLSITAEAYGLRTANPAHVLYEARTCSDMGREPTSSINEASLLAAADALYTEGFGICPKWDPSGESVEDFENRICRLIGGSFTRSLEDGQWYLDLARGDYVLADLPILTDDDILDFKEQPSTLDSAVNSVSVRYFDPERKETIVTPPVRALGLVAAFGTIHQTLDFPEIPTSGLALRVAMRELLAFTTPTRAFDLVTTRRTYAWRPNQYFRLQPTKRGIADMVCLVGEKQSGTLKSGAIRMKATQDIYSLPSTSFVEVEPGVDPTPDQTPTAITLQQAIEAPYLEIAARMSRADLAALPADAGFAMAIAATATEDIDFTMMVEPSGGIYEAVAGGQWCASAIVVETTIGPADIAFTLADGLRLDQVTVGMAALWDDEMVRVDAIDADAGTITLGRGCGDTVPAANHAAGSRLWFYEVGFAPDPTEYTDAETINVKLLSQTGSQQLAEGSATAMSITFDQRQARPYPPGKLLFSGTLLTDAAYPAQLVGSLTTKWAHRDRVLQADQLVDTDEASIGPEAGTTYTVTYEQPPGTVVNTQSGISGTSATAYSFAADGQARIAVTAQRDGLDSWQALDHTFDYLLSPPSYRLLESGDFLLLESGGRFKLE